MSALVLASVIDGAAVGKSLAAALIVGAGLTGLYGLSIRSVERIAASRRGHDTPARGIALDALIVAVTAVLCVAALVVGVIAMTHKS